MIPLRYQWSSAELPAPEYRTSAIGPVRSGRMTVPRISLMRPRIFSPAWKKYFSTPMFGAGDVVRLPSSRYAPGDHMKKPPNECMLLANLMFGYVSAIHMSFLVSGSEASDGPEKLS